MVRWHSSSGTVRSKSRVLVLTGKGQIAVMLLIMWQRVVAKLIETITEDVYQHLLPLVA